MSILKFLAQLKTLGVRIWMDGERLHVKAPAGVLDAELKQSLADRKPEIIRFLQAGKAGADPITRFLSHLRSLGIRLWLEDERLRCKAPNGVLTPDLRKQMSELKLDIVAFLSKAQDASEKSDRQKVQLLELTSVQQRLWLLYQLVPREPALHLNLHLIWHGLVEREILQQALQDLGTRHLYLRARILNRAGKPQLALAAEPLPELRVINLKTIPRDELPQELKRTMLEEARRPFNLSKGSLCRVALLVCNDNQSNLLLTVHRLAADYWSLEVLIKELVHLYEVQNGEVKLNLPDRGPAYQQLLEQGDLVKREHLLYWSHKLEGWPMHFELPHDHDRPAVQSLAGAKHPIVFTAKHNQAMRDACNGDDLFAHLFSVYAVLLFRYADHEHFLVGYPVTNRTPQTEGLVARLAETLPLRINLAGNPTFEEILQRLKSELEETQLHPLASLSALAEEMQLEPNLSRNPLCQVKFMLKQTAVDQLHMKSVRLESVPFDPGIALFDLTLRLEESEAGLLGEFEYNTDLFEASTIKRMANHFLRLLDNALSLPQTPVAELNLLNEQETRQLLHGFNLLEIERDPKLCLYHYFEEQVRRTPELVAVAMGEDTVSYQTLNEKANQLAHYLKARGVGPETFVALFTEAGLERVIGLLGILKAGGAYVPLRSGFPEQRLRFMLQDTAAPIALLTHRLAASLPDLDLQRLCLDTEWSRLQTAPTTNPDGPTKADRTAYVIYTPMSTGRPKAILGTHRALVNRILCMQESFPLNHDDRLLQRTPITSGTSLNEIFWPFFVGARVVFGKPGFGGYDDLVRLIKEQAITVLHLVPYGLRQLLGQPQAAECTGLKKIFCGAEALPLEVREQFFQVLPGTELYNLYGATESGGEVTVWRCRPGSKRTIAPIGKPIANCRIYILNDHLQLVPLGVPGELYIGGAGLADGYLNRHALTRQKFVPNPFGAGLLFKSGDLGRFLVDGNIEFLGRVDNQVKVRGLRVDLDEIESALNEYPEVMESVAVYRRDTEGNAHLVAYFTSDDDQPPESAELARFLQHSLPPEIIPIAFVRVGALPLTSEGHIDRSLLPFPRELENQERVFPRAYSEVERVIARIWREILRLEKVGVHDEFYDLGGDSLQLAEVYHCLPSFLRGELTMLDLFHHTTIHQLGLFLENEQDEAAFVVRKRDRLQEKAELRERARATSGMNIAVVGMAGRFPGADTVEELWRNLCNGMESVTFFSMEELATEGVDSELLEDPDYIRAQAIMRDVRGFDAPFFEFTPREAQITDPQHRIFLECCWEALEHAGYSAQKHSGDIGVFGGSYGNSYFTDNLKTNPQLWHSVGEFPIMVGNDKDFLASRVCFKLGLTGPGVVVQSACTTSLLAVHLAVLSLLSKSCDMVIAGGVSLPTARREGYLYEPGMLLSPDGHCRPHDTSSEGTVPGEGCAMVVLKRLEDAVAGGDCVYAVIKGSATNSDGAVHRANFTAPGTEGQPAVVRKALELAHVHPETITYIETSSTGSPLGDPIEIQSLTKVFRERTQKQNYCALGGIKGNIGILDHAAGTAAMIKAVLALYHGELPANIHYREPNPKLQLETSPFYVNNRKQKWQTEGPRRAGVSSFGLGGTNVHLVMEQGLALEPSPKARPWQMVTLSAKTPTALDTATRRLVTHLKSNPEQSITDACYTLHVGRSEFEHRRLLVCQNLHEAVLKLGQRDPERVFTKHNKTSGRPVVFMFPGQGVQYQNMGRQLYQVELTYREETDRCWEIIQRNAPELYESLTGRDRGSRSKKLHKTYVTQPATFILEYALSRLLMQWGVEPWAMIGNSLGEYVAATLAGVFSLEDALDLVCTRGRFMQGLPHGAQLAVLLSEQQCQPLLGDQLSIAGVAGPNQTMVAGTKAGIDALKIKLEDRKVDCFRLFTSHAFHSFMMDPIMAPFEAEVRNKKLSPPKIPFISTITGTWITDEQACDPAYWARQFRQPVRFSQGLELIFSKKDAVLLEVGPDKQLSTMAIRHPAKTRDHVVLAAMRQPLEEDSDIHHLHTTLGRLWLAGQQVDWHGFHAHELANRVPMPTYPFEKKAHWISAPQTRAVEDNMDLEPDEFAAVVEGEDGHYRPNVSTDFVPPRDRDEETVVRFWREYLGLSEIGIHDDFFELGGNSLIGVRLINQITREFEVPMANHILLQKRTVAMLGDFIKENRTQGASVTNSSLIELQRGRSGVQPLYLCHPIEGDIFGFRQLVESLDPRRPVYGLQAQSLLSGEPFTDIPSQATAYLAEIKSFQKKSPYLLAGFSYGGFLAYEMAYQLLSANGKVPLVAMIDTPHPNYVGEKLEDPAAILDFLTAGELRFDSAELAGLSQEEQIAFIENKARSMDCIQMIPPGFGIPMCKTWLGHQEAVHAYRPQPLANRVVYFRAMELMEGTSASAYLPWLDLVQGGIEIQQVPGNHITMMQTPNVKVIAKQFKRILRGL